MTVYAVSNVDLAPGFDARTDLAPAATKLGYALQSARSQERQSVLEALRPLVIALVALGLLAFVAGAVAVAQVVQRDRDRWRAEGATLLLVGMARGQLRLIQLAAAGLFAVLTVAIAMIVMVLAAPLAPIGALHDFDPAQGFVIDRTVAGLGAVAIVVTIGCCALAFSALPRRVRPLRVAASTVAHDGRAASGSAGRPHARVAPGWWPDPDLARRGHDDARRRVVRHLVRVRDVGGGIDRDAGPLWLRRGPACAQSIRRSIARSAGESLRVRQRRRGGDRVHQRHVSARRPGSSGHRGDARERRSHPDHPPRRAAPHRGRDRGGSGHAGKSRRRHRRRRARAALVVGGQPGARRGRGGADQVAHRRRRHVPARQPGGFRHGPAGDRRVRDP